MAAQRMMTILSQYETTVAQSIAEAQDGDVARRIWRKDAALWKTEDAHQKIIRNSLGWLTVPGKMAAVADEITAFAAEIRDSGTFKHVMVCGMGGSSLCPEVLRQTFGVQQGYPELLVLDSTDPDVLSDFGRRIEIDRCLFVISSKSGTTTEPLVFYKYWYDQVSKQKSNPGDSFIAITDPGTRMVEMATADHFRHIFLNPPDIGGRYSALSYFGLVPAALMGLDLKRLLYRAEATVRSCGDISAADNPGIVLGAIMGECAKAGRNKLTITTDSEIAALGLWIEQLVAESTGKEGQGILPVQGEPLGTADVYGSDRLFVSMAIEADQPMQQQLEALANAGHPVVTRTLNDSYDLASEFFIWEFATAVAGWRLKINPFDQPNVQESKDATRELLDYFKSHGKLQDQEPLTGDDILTIYGSEQRPALPANSVLDALRAHLATVRSGDYIALLVYVEETPEIEASLQTIRTRLRDSLHCATTTGYGPRFLHSTGQLHKGGPDTGVFIQITAADHSDLPIPEEPYTFSVLKQAQALGDFRSLSAHGRRAIRVDLGTDALAGLQRLQALLADALETPVESGRTK